MSSPDYTGTESTYPEDKMDDMEEDAMSPEQHLTAALECMENIKAGVADLEKMLKDFKMVV